MLYKSNVWYYIVSVPSVAGIVAVVVAVDVAVSAAATATVAVMIMMMMWRSCGAYVKPH